MTKLFDHILHIAPADADAQRHGRNIIVCALGLIGAALLIGILTVANGGGLPRLVACCTMILIGTLLIVVARRGHTVIAGATLIGTVQLLIVGTALATGQLRATPYALMVCVMLAGISLPPRALGLTVALSFAGLGLCGALLGSTPQHALRIYDTLAIAAVLITITGMLSLIGLRGMARSIEMAHQARLEAQRSEERYRRLIEQVPGITYLAPVSAPFEPVYASPQIASILGFAPAEWTADTSLWLRQIHPDDRARVAAWTPSEHTSEPDAHDEYRMLDRAGNILWLRDMRSVLNDAAGAPQWIQGLLVDATVRKQAEERLLHAATHDSLTRLPNRAALLERISGSLRRVCDIRGYSAAILFLDLDRFKQVNDTLGHAVGDGLLQTVAQRLTTCIRDGDLVGRLGGDEFVVLLDATATLASATRVAERINAALATPALIAGQEVRMATSIGIAMITDTYTQAEDILRDADSALYQAKRYGKGTHAIFQPHSVPLTAAQRRLADDLRQALDDDQVEVYYQPIISLSTGQINAVEALARWLHPELGWIAPEEFIPIAEEAGLIDAVGERVLRRACAQLRQWQRAGIPACHMTVNLSARQFQQRTLSTTVAAVLADTGVSGHDLKLEIRERDAMQYAETHLPTLIELKAMGVQLLVCDFGSGASSLTALKRFAIDTLKIQREFVREIIGGPAGETVVRTILAVAHSLHWDVIAEGVETEAQAEFLRAHGCDAMQGFLFSQPLPAEAMTQMLAEPRFAYDPTSASERPERPLLTTGTTAP